MSRRVLRISSIINNKEQFIFNRYVAGSGVGATNTSVRRAKLIKATRTSAFSSPTPPLPSPCGGSMEFNVGIEPDPEPVFVQYPNDGTLAIGSNDFTIEWWQYLLEDSNFPRVFSIGSYDNDDISIAVSYEGVIYLWIDGQPLQVTNENPPTNTWTHIAIVGSSGNQIKFYINGILVNTLDETYNLTETDLALSIGNETEPSIVANFIGNITNFRWVIGTQVYTSNFTPPTSPLTNITGTRLLLLSSDSENVVKDSSDSNRTPTNNGVTYSTSTPLIC